LYVLKLFALYQNYNYVLHKRVNVFRDSNTLLSIEWNLRCPTMKLDCDKFQTDGLRQNYLF